MPYPGVMREVNFEPPRSRPNRPMTFPDYTSYPDARGHFGPFGGSFVAETLMKPLQELTAA